MLGLSIGKILLTAAVIAAVYYGWKWLGRVQQLGPAVKNKVKKKTAATPPSATDAVDMVQCPACGDYVAGHGARSCGRDDCPYPG